MNEKVREIVKGHCDDESWKYHVALVVKYAKLLAKKLGSDVELAELGVLLHDIGRIKFGSENHEITGIPEAREMMKEKYGAIKLVLGSMRE